MIKLYCAEHNLVFILGCTDVEQTYFIEQLIIIDQSFLRRQI